MTSPKVRAGGTALVWRLLSDYCARRGLRLDGFDDHGHAGFVEDAAGCRRFFSGTHFDLNRLGTAKIADDKAYALQLLERDGFPVAGGLLLGATLGDGFDDARRFAEEAGYPVYLKPNEGQEGADVFKVVSPAELKDALDALSRRHRLVLVQRNITGSDLRFVVLDGDVLAVFLREPPRLTGNGQDTISALMAGRASPSAEDPRVHRELARQDLTLASVLPDGQGAVLLPNANLSAGGRGRLVTDSVPDRLKDMAVRAARSLGLRYAGVDMIVRGLDGPEPEATILEVNAAPGLNRFAAQGGTETRIVTAVYEHVFDALTGVDQ
ncbi:MAG: hypothetical protein JJ902_17765 [Roseibium sp.]|nr:hypothetical protein [Roseibium sp.]